VAQAGGQPYASFLNEKILAPLKLTATSVGVLPTGDVAAHGYRDGDPVTPWPLSEMPGTGDICSTVADLARFTAGVHSGSLISDRSVHAMITAHAPLPDGQSTSDRWARFDGYGYGLYIGCIAGHTAYLHTGDNPGYQSLAVWLPGPAACAVILSNEEAADTEALLRQLIPAALHKDER
jgi:CubicO group peptidase (beta-lactamase class C family)